MPVNRSFAPALALAAALALPGALAAQDSTTFVAQLLGGFGGSFDAQGDQDFDHKAFEAGFGVLTNDRTYSMFRIGQLKFAHDLDFEGITNAKLTFVTAAGEYRFRQPSYDFGLYLGLGGYELTGRDAFGNSADERALGLVLGLTGDFDITRHVSFVGEFAAHYAFLERADLYGLALAGVAVHF